MMLKKLLLAGLLCATVALAQDGGGGGYGGKKGGGGDMGAPMGGPPSSNRFENIANALNLNKDQRKSVRAILDDGAKEAAPLRDQLGKSRVAVGEAITAKKSDEELKQVAKTSSDVAVQLTQVEIRTFAKVFGALDDTQKKDMRALGRVLALMNGMYHNKNWNEE
jgi:Spy/CpxP family protein refolding chaperone